MSQDRPTQKKKPLVIFAHSDGFDRLYQMSSIALTSAANGHPVVIALFFWALRAVARGKMDELRFSALDPEAQRETERRVRSANNPLPSEMLSMARETGMVRLLACSASVQYLGLELEETASKVDEIVGMATILRLAQDAAEVIYI
ncbi:MAG TPA: DsrE family protein [archaeon]|nr:DsrE family protein [archaeon]